ncbi:MAG: NAD-dependent epimerase/dehydratase family protein [bacterium]|nr:NAD-dependent epimerase/dehydratase family protein [bacterium]
MSKKTVLVCGATGFVGRNVAERLAESGDYEVYGTYFKSEPLTHPKIKMIHTDLSRKEEVEKVVAGKDIVIQGAATTSGAKDIVARPYIHVTDNAIMNSLIFRAAHDFEVPRMIFFSCSIMYQPRDLPLKEDDFNAGDDIHEKYYGGGWTKVYLEKMCKFFSDRGKTKYTVIRHSNNYGPYDKYDLEKSHVCGATITKVMLNKDGIINVWGSGEEERDLLYIDDLVDFVELALRKQETAFELVNVSYGSSISVDALVKKIIQLSGRKLNITYDPAGSTIKTKLALDNSKAKKLFGWQPKTSLDDGLKKTIEWFQKNLLE